MRRHFVIVTVLATALFSVAAMINFYRYFINRDLSVNGQILAYQLAKLQHAAAMDTIFVGDSSLGNGLDAAYFDHLAGTRSMNLALTGSHHFAGTLNMIRRVLDQGGAVKRIVVMQSLWVWQGASSYDGYIQTAGGFWLVPTDLLTNLRLVRQLGRTLLDVGSAIQPDHLAAALRYMLTGESGRVTTASTFAAYDFQSRENRFDPEVFRDYVASAINPDADRFLRHIGALCASHGITCIYVHGPTFEPVAAQWRPYLPEINSKIRAAGLTLVDDEAFTFGLDDRGDSEFHVHPSAKKRYTRRYVALLSSFLPLAD